MNNNISEMPDDLVEYIKNKKLIDSIINNWFKDFEHITNKIEDIDFIKAIIANCMISYKRILS